LLFFKGIELFYHLWYCYLRLLFRMPAEWCMIQKVSRQILFHYFFIHLHNRTHDIRVFSFYFFFKAFLFFTIKPFLPLWAVLFYITCQIRLFFLQVFLDLFSFVKKPFVYKVNTDEPFNSFEFCSNSWRFCNTLSHFIYHVNIFSDLFGNWFFWPTRWCNLRMNGFGFLNRINFLFYFGNSFFLWFFLFRKFNILAYFLFLFYLLFFQFRIFWRNFIKNYLLQLILLWQLSWCNRINFFNRR